MTKRFEKKTFSEQIRFYYILLFLLVFIICGGLYLVTARRLVESSEDKSLDYSLQMVEGNMESLLKNINDDSKIIAYNEVVQNTLQMEMPLDYESRANLQDTINQIAACCEGISSIYLFDNEGEAYTAGNVYEVEEIRSYLKETSMYQSELKKSGGSSKDSFVFSYQTYLDENRQIISFIRKIRNLDTMEDMGILAINIPATRILETFSQISQQNNMEIAVLDQDKNIIAASSEGDWLKEMSEKEKLKTGTEAFKVVLNDGKRYRIGKVESESQDWSVVAALPRSETLAAMQAYALFSVICILAGMGMCVFGASRITRRINRPLKNILSSMEQVKEGRLERVEVIETNAEMDELQKHYNQMLDETDQLMTQKVEEQRMRRKYELSLLQAQIKPHFLYNTFDSVCALAMMGETKAVYTMMQALGQYYRKSLHKGQQIIPVKEEIEIVENYLIIQSFRYDDVFEVEYDIDDSVKDCKTVKLILQPLVENAIYHGFRENDLQGTITIRAKDDGDYIKFQVEDDGIGMEKEKLDRILYRTEDSPEKRFGLFGTIQRIQLYYQQENLVQIDSEVGRGTVITVRIPKEKDEEI